jgi:tRNA 5-methylaminomethyl-2-thiouridine biosynthesis bifunctional protein
MFSQEFGDIYFSLDNGLAETEYTFLQGNHLPESWQDHTRFCICETGFGTGLNMLAAWKLFEETAAPTQKLDLISIEKFPLAPAQISEALQPWADVLSPYLETLLGAYPMRVRGFHRINLTPRVTLTLIFDDVQTALPQINAQVDAWFLDGFAPAKNPDMWCDALYKNMARLSHVGTTLATFTAAGDVRRGLAENGFAVEKRKGYGRKRDMVVGRFMGAAQKQIIQSPKTVAIIGAGLAGLSAAWHLKQAGCAVTVYESADSIAAKASGNARGIVNPKLTAKPSPQSNYYTSAYAYALRVLKTLPGIEYALHGSLHLQLNDDKARRFQAYCDNLGWNAAHMQYLDAQTASDIAGIGLNTSCLYYPDAAALSPLKLCAALAQDIDVRLNSNVADYKSLNADAVIVANASDVIKLFPNLPVSPVRGQVSVVSPNDVSKNLRINLSYGGYITPLMQNGLHMCGATFQPWGESVEVLTEDHIHNLELLAASVPALKGLEVQGGRTAFRASSRDRVPIIGMYENCFVSVAHGSHGIISGLMAGCMASSQLTGAPLPIGQNAALAVSPDRFHKG